MRQSNVAGYLVAMGFLLQLVAVGALSASLTQLASTQRGDDVSAIQLKPTTLFARKYIGGASSTYTFLDNTTEKIQGICNIDKGKLAQNEAFIFNEIAIGYKVGNADQAGAVAYDAALPAALRNAEFIIRQNGRTVYEGTCAELSNPYTGVREEDNWTRLNSLCYISDNEDITIEIKFAPGASIAAAQSTNDYSYLEVRMRGHKTVKRTV
jgi:hypothetical protein